MSSVKALGIAEKHKQKKNTVERTQSEEASLRPALLLIDSLNIMLPVLNICEDIRIENQ
jgi:hypothetical protein